MEESRRKKLIFDYVWSSIDPVDFVTAQERNYLHNCAICNFPYSSMSTKNNFTIELSRMIDQIAYSPHDGYDQEGVETNSFHICSKCNDTIVIEESIYEQEDTIRQDIRNYLMYGKLPDMVAAFDVYRTNIETNCVFCSRRVAGEDMIPGKMVVPQGNSSTILSYVHMCSHCQETYDNLADRLEDRGLHYDECPECDMEYPLTDDEFKIRRHNDLLNHYCCNDCCSEQNITGMEAAHTTPCSKCNDVQTVEITSQEVIKVLKTGASVADILQAITCDDCKDRILLDSTYNYEGSTILLHQDTEGHYYTVDKGKITETKAVTPYEKKYAALLAAYDLIDWRKKTNYGS